MGRPELIANDFVRSQTEEKIRNEQIRGTGPIIGAPFEVGQATRETIARIGGTPPEDLPPEAAIRPLLEQRTRHQRGTRPAPDAPSRFDALPDHQQRGDGACAVRLLFPPAGAHLNGHRY